MLKTELCEQLGIQHPILSAGFAAGAGPEVVAAVSNAGGCGVLGGSGFSVPYLREQIRRVRGKTSKPFGVNLILDEIEEGPIEACLEEQVPLLVFFWGDPRPYVQPAHTRGVKLAIQVGPWMRRGRRHRRVSISSSPRAWRRVAMCAGRPGWRC